ncbi:hypothetical protein CGLO_08259 [Colletotrichum gloeosporioides Cg-14]|uniref:Uncharacterized protein n=1 Tax=Colletotrichum gloeosporioides (strain Cg-14) TaxID=1237896 RepID=T0K9B3_COLGC|nr:hypothetical protein CGLO_08259 [Colletotrichum gloeosporioides Cg-14]
MRRFLRPKARKGVEVEGIPAPRHQAVGIHSITLLTRDLQLTAINSLNKKDDLGADVASATNYRMTDLQSLNGTIFRPPLGGMLCAAGEERRPVVCNTIPEKASTMHWESRTVFCFKTSKVAFCPSHAGGDTGSITKLRANRGYGP